MAVDTPPIGASGADVVRWSIAAVNRGDFAALRASIAAETVERFPDRTCRGPDEIVAYFEQTRAAVPDWHMEIAALVEQGEDVFVHWHLTGTHLGPLLGIEPTGKALAIDGIDHFVVRDGRVVSNFVVFDQMQWARTIGLLPPDGSVADRALKVAFNARTRLVKRVKRT